MKKEKGCCAECANFGKLATRKLTADKKDLKGLVFDCNKNKDFLVFPSDCHKCFEAKDDKTELVKKYNQLLDKPYQCPGPERTGGIGSWSASHKFMMMSYNKCKRLDCGCKTWDEAKDEINLLKDEINARR